MVEVRCPNCNKLLLKVDGKDYDLEIKCNKCKQIIEQKLKK